MDFEQFTKLFSQMTVREVPRKRWRKKIQGAHKSKRASTPPPKPDRSAATIFITTKPPPAPLPALIRSTITPYSPMPTPMPKLPTVPISTSRKRRAFASPDADSTSTTLVPRAESETEQELAPRKRRKVASLPKRVPNGTSIAHRAVASTATDVSDSSSSSHLPVSSLSSRAPSSGSASSKRTRLSSDSSSASEVATPEATSQPLPTNIQLPALSSTGSDFNSSSTLSDLFSHSPADPSQAEGLQLEFPSSLAYGNDGVDKAPWDFGFDPTLSSQFLHVPS